MSRSGRSDLRVVVTALSIGIVTFLYSLATYLFSDDHFGRISPARQIGRYGELPFRDFFDPGYFLTELSSAAVQWVFGDNLLGEMLLTSSFVAGGAVSIFLLARRSTGSPGVAVVAAVAAVLAFRRPYDYDKFLFYPLGLLLCWRYIDAPTAGRLIVVAAVAVVAGMFRYDNGLFIGISAVVALAATHARELSRLVRRSALLAAASAVLLAPYALFLQTNGGVTGALDQMMTYARREGARTRIGSMPSGMLSEFRVTRLPPPPPDRVQIRWTPGADGQRAALESRYTLHDGVREGEPEERIWRYEIDNASRENLRALVNDPAVADTALIDRANLTVAPQESWRRRLRRRIPFGTTSVAWSPEGAAAAVYYLVLASAFAAIVLAVRADPVSRARVLSAAAMTLVAVALVMREPVIARIGGVIGPPAVLAAWLWYRAARLRVTRVVAAVCVLASLAVATEWRWSLHRLQRRLQTLDLVIHGAVTVPPPTREFPKPRIAGLVDYLRRCTMPDDRVFAGWFIPELYYFSQRAFAGGMVVTFGDHWSEPQHQRRIVAKLTSESVPVAILLRDGRPEFRESYPLVDDHLLANYDEAASLTFGPDSDTYYTVLTRRGRMPTGQDPVFAIPCFAMPDAR